MKNIKCSKKLFYILFILYSLLILSKGDIFNNPLLISDKPNPIVVRSTSGYYYIFTSGEAKVLDSTGAVVATNDFGTYSNPYTWINDQNNNHYIFTQQEYYKVTFSGTSTTCTAKTKPSLTYTTSYLNIASISESFNFGNTNPGCLCPILINEVIIYGKTGTYDLIFTFMKRGVSYTFRLGTTSIEHKIACKKIDSGQYFCGIIYLYTVHTYLFSHVSVDAFNCEMRNPLDSTFNDLMTDHTSIEIYDTELSNQKILCAKNRATFEIECILVIVTIQTVNSGNSCSQTQKVEYSNILWRLPTSSTSMDDCFFRNFAGEMLLCCTETDTIRCTRMSGGTSTVFNLEFAGSNSKLYFFTDSNSYANFIFLNTNSDQNKVYEYFIYLPSCKDLNYTTIVYHSVNEEKEENEKDNLIDLFERKTNTEYYIEFDNLPDDYGDLTVNDEKIITGNNTKILLEQGNSYILDFNSTNDNSVTNYQIPYKILIKETYSASCSINLTILPCYDSCSRCSKDKSSSTSENHNCLEDKCKTGYYPSPLLLTNCFTEEEKEINWYLNYSIKRFALCDEKCNSCYGPDSDNCLTCFNPEVKNELIQKSNQRDILNAKNVIVIAKLVKKKGIIII